MSDYRQDLIVKKLSEVGKELKAVHMVNMQRYKARHIYDVYNRLQPILAKHGLVITRQCTLDDSKEVTSGKGTKGVHRYQRWKFTFWAEDSSNLTTEFPAESVDWGDKAASQCDAMAFKQMLIHTFLIPTEDMKDPDDAPAADMGSKQRAEPSKQPQAGKPSAPHREPQAKPSDDFKDYVMQKGKMAGRRVMDIPMKELSSWVKFMESKGFTNGQDFQMAREAMMAGGNAANDGPPDWFGDEEIPF